MNFASLVRVVKAGFVSFYRNGWLSVAATGIVTFTLVLISIFLLLMLLGQNIITSIQKKIDVEVFFNDTAKVTDIQTIKEQLEQQPNTESVRYISKAEALEIYKGQRESNRKLVEQISEEDNPLPPSLQIKARDPNKLDTFDTVLASDFAKPLVDKRTDKENRPIIDQLKRIISFIRSVGLFISSVVLIFSILVVFNTIRITIFSRREEIEIMRLVGASNWYIRGPFITEGVFYGIIATLVAMLVVYLMVLAFGPRLTESLGDVDFNAASYLQSQVWLLLAAQLLIGIVVGVVSSMIAIRRHLKN